MPMDNADPIPPLPDGAKQLLRNYVAKVQPADDRSKGAKDTDFLNSIFGWDLAEANEQRDGYELNTANAKGTLFEQAPASAPYHNTTEAISRGSVEQFKAIYGTDEQAAAALIGYGKGRVIYLGEDYWEMGRATDWGAGTHREGRALNVWANDILPLALEYATSSLDYELDPGHEDVPYTVHAVDLLRGHRCRWRHFSVVNLKASSGSSAITATAPGPTPPTLGGRSQL